VVAADLAVHLAVDLARHLPPADLTRLAAAAAAGPEHLISLRADAASPLLRDACTRLAAHCDISSERLAGLLLGAAAAEESATSCAVQVVWTGPASEIQTSRLTAPAVTELVDSAADELLLVSFASHDEPRLVGALQVAIARGVDLTILLERPEDNPAYTGPRQAFAGLPARRWIWPRLHRLPGAALHAKILVVDRRAALLGSANLTGRALDANLECGVLLQGGPQPAAIRDHLWSLRYHGVLIDA